MRQKRPGRVRIRRVGASWTSLSLAIAVVLIGAVAAVRDAAAGERPCSEAAPCAVATGDYLLSFPPEWDGQAPLPAVMFFHGHNASALSTVRSGGLRQSFVERGYLLIAPNGAPRASGVRSFPARPGFGGGRDDISFALAVLEDAAQRVPLD